jgi:hypothetical protein
MQSWLVGNLIISLLFFLACNSGDGEGKCHMEYDRACSNEEGSGCSEFEARPLAEPQVFITTQVD